MEITQKNLSWEEKRELIFEYFDGLVDDGKITHKALGKDNIAYFAHHYFGMDIPHHQQTWFNTFDNHSYTLLLSPRDHGKTTVVSRLLVEHKSLYIPDHRTLLFSKSYRQSMKSLDVVIQDIKKNKKIKRDFAQEMDSFRKKENMMWLNVENAQRDATVEANGLMGSVTGSHFDMIINDDLVDDENTRTPMQMEQVDAWFKGTVSPLLEPGGKMVAIGTRKHYNDLYSGLIENPLWHVHRDKAIMKFPEKYEFVKDNNGNVVDVKIWGKSQVLWKEKWDIRHLLLKKAEIGSIFFNREYQNDPAGLQGKVLNRDWLNFYKERDIYTKKGDFKMNFTIFQAYDLAITEKVGGDFFVGITVGVTDKHDIYVLDIFRDQLAFPEQVKKVLTLAERHNPVLIGIESVAYQRALAQQVGEIAFLPIDEVQSTANKETRIKASSVHYENGRVFLPEDLAVTDDFINEYVQFPKGQHDDLIDCMDIVFGLVRGSSVNVNPFLIVGHGKNI